MPRRYVRKAGARPRALWTEDALKSAFEELRENRPINEISRRYGIPSRTLRRRFTKNDTEKLTLGKHPVLDFNNENRLVKHVQKLETAGFPVTRDIIRRLAFEFAEKLGINHNFDKETCKAGPHWLQSFMERHPELSVRQAEGLSLARAQGLNREEVNKMFQLLLKVLTEHDLLDKPDRILNIDETGVQLNNKPGKVIATRGSKSVHSVTSGEKGETMSIIACCNAVGNFLSPVVIIKGVNKKPEFQEGLPPGSNVYMSKKSAYVNAQLFQKWLLEHFIPRKPQGNVILLLDGHPSHTNSADMLETAEENNIILFCLPSHSTQALQPLDRSFFKPFKTFYAAETRNWMVLNKNKKICRSVIGKLIGNAWIRSATPSNAVSGFKACGIYPYNPTAIPETFFAISDLSSSTQACAEHVRVTAGEHDASPGTSIINWNLPNVGDEIQVSPSLIQTRSSSPNTYAMDNLPGSPSSLERVRPGASEQIPPNSPSILLHQPGSEVENETPSKYLHECSPVPKIPVPFNQRRKQSAAVLTTKENIASKKNKGKITPNIPCKNSKPSKNVVKKRTRAASEETEGSLTCASEEENEPVAAKKKKEKRAKRGKERNETRSTQNTIRPGRKVQTTKPKAKTCHESDESLSNESDSLSLNATNDYECVECFEEYRQTKSKVDWIQCIMCKKWLHENCTMYGDYCNQCQRTKLLHQKRNKLTN